MIDKMATPSIKVVQEWFTAMENHDADAITALYTDDITETIPLNSSGKPDPQAFFNGKNEVLGYAKSILANFKQTKMQDKVFTASADGSIVFCEARGDLIAAKDSKPYLNLYVFRFDVKDGCISQIKEYANPVTYSQLMGLPVG